MYNIDATTKTAIYTRLALHNQLRISEQLAACQDFCRGHSLTISEAYSDNGKSGVSLDRSGLQSLLASVGAKTISIVVVYDVDRLSRSFEDLEIIFRQFREAGIQLYSVRTGELIDLRESSYDTATSVLSGQLRAPRAVRGRRLARERGANRAEQGTAPTDQD
jgi:DNA invertase Pin-like site-specific DNA recombinase